MSSDETTVTPPEKGGLLKKFKWPKPEGKGWEEDKGGGEAEEQRAVVLGMRRGPKPNCAEQVFGFR